MKRSRPTVASLGNVRGNALDEDSLSSCALRVTTMLLLTKLSSGKSKAFSCPLPWTKSSPHVESNRGMLTEVSCALASTRTLP